MIAKQFDSVEHSILLFALHEVARYKRKGLVFLSTSVSMLWSNSVHHTCPTSPSLDVCNKALCSTFFLVIMDKLLCELNENKRVSIFNLYLGSAADADNDVRTLATSACAAANQGTLVQNFAANHGLHHVSLNCAKTEIIKFSKSAPNSTSENHVNSIPITSQAKFLGGAGHYVSARAAVEENISNARQKFFVLGSTGCYLGHSKPSTAKTIAEFAVLPTRLCMT